MRASGKGKIRHRHPVKKSKRPEKKTPPQVSRWKREWSSFIGSRDEAGFAAHPANIWPAGTVGAWRGEKGAPRRRGTVVTACTTDEGRIRGVCTRVSGRRRKILWDESDETEYKKYERPAVEGV